MGKNKDTTKQVAQVLIDKKLAIYCKILSIHRGITRKKVLDTAISQYLEREKELDEKLAGHLTTKTNQE